MVRSAESRKEQILLAKIVDQARVVDDRFDIRQRLVKLPGFDGLGGAGHPRADVIRVKDENLAELGCRQLGLTGFADGAGEIGAIDELFKIDLGVDSLAAPTGGGAV